jgi:AcrR family transcriptional regulator
MTPRPYQLGQRQAAADRTRARVLRAARALLAGKGADRFSLDAVAVRARVARMTVYHQFGSKRGLFEAMFDEFAAGAHLPEQLGEAFQRADPEATLAEVILIFARFWGAGRPWIRRVRALGVLDAELGAALEGRNGRRRMVMRTVIDRFIPLRSGRSAEKLEEVQEMLYALTSFETYDALAGPDRDLEAVVPAITRLARMAVGVSA